MKKIIFWMDIARCVNTSISATLGITICNIPMFLCWQNFATSHIKEGRCRRYKVFFTKTGHKLPHYKEKKFKSLYLEKKFQRDLKWVEM
jgi:hypothetical protein